MATVVEESLAARPELPDVLPAHEHVLLRGISWGTYEALLKELEGNRKLQLTFDSGDLEIMSPSHKHEWGKRYLGRMVEAFTEELGIPIASAGSTTFKWKLRDKGIEPDECYYLKNEAKIRGKDDLDLEIDPPPDLAIEVEATKRILKRLPIYAGLGFPEVWQLNRAGEIKVHLLQPDGSYTPGRDSACLPKLPLEKLEEFLRQHGETDETTWIRGFRAWVRTLSPR